MTTYRSLNHTKCAVSITWYSFRSIAGRRCMEACGRSWAKVFRRLAVHRESEVEEGHLLPDHVHMMMSIPPKYSVAQVIGYLKGKSAIHIAREFAGRSRNFVGQHFGPGATSSPRWGAMSGSSGSTSSSRNAKIGDGLSCRWIRVATVRWLK